MSIATETFLLPLSLPALLCLIIASFNYLYRFDIARTKSDKSILLPVFLYHKTSFYRIFFIIIRRIENCSEPNIRLARATDNFYALSPKLF